MTQGRVDHATAARDRIPWVVLIAYGLGGVVPIALFNSVGQLSGLILNVGLGVSAVLVGVAQMAPRFWDAFTDPIMGHISDNTRSRWGRRRPYIVAGGVLVALSFVGLWSVPAGWSQGAQFWYFLVALLVFYTAVTMFEIPHGALGMEMTDDYHERTRLFSAKSFVGNVGAIVTAWFYFLANTDLFRGKGGNEVDGMRNVSYLAAVLILIPAFACAYFCREGKLAQARTQRRVSLRVSLGQTARNRSFLVLVGIVFATVMGFHLVNNLANYIAIFYLYGGDRATASHLLAVNGTIWSVTSLAAIFPLVWLSRRMGKSWTLTLAVGLMAGAQALKIVCYNPDLPELTYIPTALLAAGMLMFFTLASAMVADVCDADELATGTRSEGAYYSVFWWFMKMGMGVAALLNGLLIAVTGFDEKVAVQSQSTLLLLRAFEIGLPIVLCGVSVLLIRRYPLTEARAYQIKQQLEAARAAATPPDAPNEPNKPRP
jgi:GPH family glycoside/pentoside/hexuronide:cation symporter